MNIAPITRFAHRTTLKLKKNSPQILFYGGIVGTVATTVLASRATLKAVPVVEHLQDQRREVEALAESKMMTAEEHPKAVAQVYTIAAVELTKIYALPTVVGVVSIAALTKSHQQLMTRNNALTMAFTGLYETFNRYRGRVRDQLGDEIDQQFLHGTTTKQVQVGTNKDGSPKMKEMEVLDTKSQTPFTVMFDAECPAWSRHSGYNQNMLDAQQTWANIRLRKQGHLFLNEVFELLMLPHTPIGGQIGWVFTGDEIISFGLEKNPEFVNGFSKNAMLEFNVHGPILDLI